MRAKGGSLHKKMDKLVNPKFDERWHTFLQVGGGNIGSFFSCRNSAAITVRRVELETGHDQRSDKGICVTGK